MTPLVSIIMGSTSDMKVMSQAAEFLNSMEIPFEINALSAHRVPEMVADFAKNAHKRGIKVIIAAAGGAAHLPGVIAAITPLPVIGVPNAAIFDKFVKFKSELADKIAKANVELAAISFPYKTN